MSNLPNPQYLIPIQCSEGQYGEPISFDHVLKDINKKNDEYCTCQYCGQEIKLNVSPIQYINHAIKSIFLRWTITLLLMIIIFFIGIKVSSYIDEYQSGFVSFLTFVGISIVVPTILLIILKSTFLTDIIPPYPVIMDEQPNSSGYYHGIGSPYCVMEDKPLPFTATCYYSIRCYKGVSENKPGFDELTNRTLIFDEIKFTLKLDNNNRLNYIEKIECPHCGELLFIEIKPRMDSDRIAVLKKSGLKRSELLVKNTGCVKSGESKEIYAAKGHEIVRINPPN